MSNPSNPSRCPVQAALRIRARAICLGVPPHLPIAVFQNSTGSSQYIDDFHVTHKLQSLARSVYNITTSSDLARFTTHSLRVGACVLLHETSQTPDFIKARLRWRSDAYLMYLRNTPKLANLHNIAINESDQILSDTWTRFCYLCSWVGFPHRWWFSLHLFPFSGAGHWLFPRLQASPVLPLCVITSQMLGVWPACS